MTIEEITISNRNDHGLEIPEVLGGKIRNRARVHSGAPRRDGTDPDPGAPITVSGSGITLRDRFVAWVLSVGRRAQECAPYSGRPRSIRAVVEYTARGGWVPGHHAWWVELPGYLYGCVVAIPLTIVAHTVQCVGSRLLRALAVLAVYGLLVWLAPVLVEVSWWRVVLVWVALSLVSTALVIATAAANTEEDSSS